MNKIFSFLIAAVALTLGSCARETGVTNVTTSESKIDHLIIKEVFYAGHAIKRDLSAYKMPSTYTRNYDDQYITIYNPTQKTLYLDSLALVTNQVDPRVILEFAPGDNFIGQYYGGNSVMYFPGSGTDHPVKPGQTIVVAKRAIDHAQAFVKSIEAEGESVKGYEGYDQLLDLSKADFEWDAANDADNNAAVPDLLPISSDRAFSTIAEAVGIALVRLPWSPAAFKEGVKRAEAGGPKAKGNTVVHYVNVTNTHFGDFLVVEIPFDKVIDCLTICPRKRFQMRPSKLDKGFLGVSEDDFSTFKITSSEILKVMGLSLQRKFDGKGFVDTDNTTTDFEVKPASLSRKAAAPEKPAAKPAQ